MAPRFRYQRVVVPGSKPTTWSRGAGPSARGKGLGGGVELAHEGVQWLGRIGRGYRVKRGIEGLMPEIERKAPHGGGALVEITHQKSRMPDPTGVYHEGVQDVSLAGFGKSPGEVMHRHFSHDRIGQGAPEGFRFHSEYVWVTPDRKPEVSSPNMGERPGGLGSGVGSSRLSDSVLQRMRQNLVSTQPSYVDQDGDGIPDYGQGMRSNPLRSMAGGLTGSAGHGQFTENPLRRMSQGLESLGAPTYVPTVTKDMPPASGGVDGNPTTPW